MTAVTNAPADQAQRDLAVATIGRPVSVEAGAGTGKTTLLVDRALHLLLERGVSILSLVLVTFTEKAAAELRGRMRFKLEQLRRDASDDVAERCEEALSGLDGAHIETIHSFCTRILREFALEAGLQPDFNVIDALQTELHQRETWLAWLDRELARPDSRLPDAIDLGVRLGNIRELMELAEAQRHLAPFAAPEPPDGMTPVEFVEWFSGPLGEMEALVEANIKDRDDAGARQIERLRRQLDALQILDPVHYPGELVSWKISKTAGAKDHWEGESCKEVKAIFLEAATVLDESRARTGGELLAGLIDGSRDYVDFAKERRRQAGVLNFDDLLLEARDLVRDRAEVRATVRRRFAFLMIDEFQDTDPVQTELILTLASRDDPSAPTGQALDGGKLFIVGDPKQSIYRFRRADIVTYKATVNDLAARKGADLTISESFRATAPLLAWVNRVFDPAFAAGDSERQARYVPIGAAKPNPASGPAIALLKPADSDDLATAGGARRAESRAVAAALAGAVAENGWMIRDGVSGERRARPNDCAVLLPTRAMFEELKFALEAAGLPYVVETPAGFFGQDDVNDLINILRAIETPWNAIAVVAALRSAAFACSDRELFAFRAEGGSFNPISPGSTAGGAVGRALDRLAELHRDRYAHSLALFVDRVLETTGLLLHAATRRSGLQSTANLRRIVELARVFEEREGPDLSQFVGWLEERGPSGSRREEARLDIENMQAIRIMTVHAAKGLEFPIVVLAGLGAERRGGSASVRVHVNRSTGEFQARLAKDIQTAGLEAEEADEKILEIDETVRLLYVAATRARDTLVLSTFQPAKAKESPLELLMPYLGDVENAGDGAEVDGQRVIVAPPDTGDEAPQRAGILEAAPDGDRAGGLKDRNQALEETKQTINLAQKPLPRVTASGDKPFDRPEHRPAMESSVQEKPKTRGKVFHEAMERLEIDADEATIDAVVGDLCWENDIIKQAPGIKDLCRATLNSDVIDRARDAGRVFRELPFTVAVDGVIVSGAMDLVIEDADGLTIVDYKSDRDMAPGHYRGQAGIYALALERITGTRPGQVLIFYASRSETDAIAVDEELLTEARASILRQATASAS